jgi:hypothetical protein
MWHEWSRRETRTGFWCGKLRGGDQLEDLSINVRIILRGMLKK